MFGNSKNKLPSMEYKAIKEGLSAIGTYTKMSSQIITGINYDSLDARHKDYVEFVEKNYNTVLYRKLAQKKWDNVSEYEIGSIIYYTLLVIHDFKKQESMMPGMLQSQILQLEVLLEVCKRQFKRMYPDANLFYYVQNDIESLAEIILDNDARNTYAFKNETVLNMIAGYKEFIESQNINNLILSENQTELYKDIEEIQMTGLKECAVELLKAFSSKLGFSAFQTASANGMITYCLMDLVSILDKSLSKRDFYLKINKNILGDAFFVPNSIAILGDELEERRKKGQDKSVNQLISTNLIHLANYIKVDVNDEVFVGIYANFVSRILYFCEFKMYWVKKHFNKSPLSVFADAENIANKEMQFIRDARSKRFGFPENDMMAFSRMGAITNLLLKNKISNMKNMKQTFMGINYYNIMGGWPSDETYRIYTERDIASIALINDELSEEWASILMGKDITPESDQFIDETFALLAESFRMDSENTSKSDFDSFFAIYAEYVSQMRELIDSIN